MTDDRKPRVTKPCPLPDCMGTLVLRRAKGREYLDCDQCKHVEPLPIDIRLRRQGAPSFFD